jgi:rubrerythrin
MTHHDVDAEKKTGTPDVTYNLVSILYHALHGGENYAVYARDAKEAGDDELAGFFNQLVQEERNRADRTKQLLKNRL